MGLGSPVRLLRKITGVVDAAYNRVMLEDESGNVINSGNPLPTSGGSSSSGLVSINNSSATPLGIDGVFTGVGDDVTQYSSVSITWSADVDSANSGMLLQFSTNNVNWDKSIPVESHVGASETEFGGIHRLAITAKYFRVIFTNGAIAQANFRLQVLYHTFNSMPLISRMEQQLNTTSDVALIRPVTNIQLDLARRQITGQRTFFFFGFNNDIDAGVWEDIWAAGGDINWLTTATKVEVLSTHAADTALGLGCRSVELHGLSATGVDQSEVIALSGVTPVESALTYIRVNKLHNQTVGTYGGSHQGNIICRVTGVGAVLTTMTGVEGAVDSSVQYGSGEAGNSFYSVPLGKVAYLTRGEISINKTGVKTADVVLYEREGILTTSAPFLPRRIIWDAIEVQGEVPIVFSSFIKIKALTDVWFRANASNANTKIEAQLEFFLVDANLDGE